MDDNIHHELRFQAYIFIEKKNYIKFIWDEADLFVDKYWLILKRLMNSDKCSPGVLNCGT
jgi:hypothetical protein